MPVIQGNSAYSTKAELIPGIWRGFSAVQLLPVLSAGLGCSFGQGGEMAAFSVFFLSLPLSLPSLLSCLTCSSRVSLLSVSLSAMGYSAALAAVSPSADLGRLLSGFCWPCLQCRASGAGALLSVLASLPLLSATGQRCGACLLSVLALRLLSVRLLAVAVCPSLCLAVMISTACALCPLSVLPSLAAGWLYVQAIPYGQFAQKLPCRFGYYLR